MQPPTSLATKSSDDRDDRHDLFLIVRRKQSLPFEPVPSKVTRTNKLEEALPIAPCADESNIQRLSLTR